MDYELIICFETHVELNTGTKLFCDCAVSYDSPPNSRICPVCTGQPGALPVLNKKAVEYCICAGLALDCRINRQSRFAPKNYFYPDLPKGYQISQYERPFCEDGTFEILGDDGHPYPVGIKRIHLEEDAGKLVHSSYSLDDSEYSLIDYNRSSVPLLEIVTDHERNPMRSIHEARTYLEKLRQTLRYIEISECIIERGQFRCDVNISIRPKGAREFGNRAEIKNMASFRFIMNALEFEIERQKDILETGGKIPQETRSFDEQKGITLPMRSKEDAPDYRYFPDPDLLEVAIEEQMVQKIRDRMPELPDQKVNRIIKEYGIPKQDALVLTKDKSVSEFFETCAGLCADKKKIGTWIIKDLFKLLNEATLSIDQSPVKPEAFACLVNLVLKGEITDQSGRAVLEEMFRTCKDPEVIIEEQGLKAIQDRGLLDAVVREVLKENPGVVETIMGGEKKPIGFLIGQVMKKTGGKANPKKVKAILEDSIG